MSIGKRIGRIASGYLDQTLRRLEDLDSAMDPTGIHRAEAEKEFLDSMEQPRPLPEKPKTVEAPDPTTTETLCYKTLGLKEGAALTEVRTAYAEIAQRADPSKYEEGTEERAKAESIRDRVDRAYQYLLKKLDPSVERFSEIDIP
ncbi:MAG: hypothetical protein HUU60_00385 [Armatimonadetes bacterium]|nr:hypothetical protein [Armatimonadota bacterium]